MLYGTKIQHGEGPNSESSVSKHRDTHKQLSLSISRTMFSLLAYSATCWVIILQPDVPFVLTSGGVQIPLINVAVSLNAFMIIGPFCLISITTYLYLFLSKLDRVPEIKKYEKQQSIFNFNDGISRFLCFLLFYACPISVMVGFCWKSAVSGWRFLMILVTIVMIIVILAFYVDRRKLCAAKSQNEFYLKNNQISVVKKIFETLSFRYGFGSKVRLLFEFLVTIISIFVILFFSLFLSVFVRRPLNLERAQLKEAYLLKIDLSDANLSNANLWKANLREASLYHAKLREADLSETDLRSSYMGGADLSGTLLNDAKMIRAHMNGCNLNSADLTGADLRGADLSNANLNYADLTRAVLIGANLEGISLHRAILNETVLSKVNNLKADQICKALSIYKIEISNEMESQVKEVCPDRVEEIRSGYFFPPSPFEE
jgi:uncharacterized protein YjbI with pentapeptide repeats